MKIDTHPFRVRAGHPVNLKKWPTRIPPFYASEAHYQATLAKHVASMSERQNLLYANNRFALLLIFQAMDAAGKDGTIKHVSQSRLKNANAISKTEFLIKLKCFN